MKKNHLHRAFECLLILIFLFGCTPRYARQSEPKKKQDSIRKSNQILDKLQRKAANRRHYRLFREIRFYLGTPYCYGGDNRRGVDCSGFVMVIFRDVYGQSLPHSAAQQYLKSSRLRTTDLRAGDLVFFDINRSGTVDHVGIYLDEGYFAHASSSQGVVISNLSESYYRNRFIAAGRVLR